MRFYAAGIDASQQDATHDPSQGYINPRVKKNLFHYVNRIIGV